MRLKNWTREYEQRCSNISSRQYIYRGHYLNFFIMEGIQCVSIAGHDRRIQEGGDMNMDRAGVEKDEELYNSEATSFEDMVDLITGQGEDKKADAFISKFGMPENELNLNRVFGMVFDDIRVALGLLARCCKVEIKDSKLRSITEYALQSVINPEFGEDTEARLDEYSKSLKHL